MPSGLRPFVLPSCLLVGLALVVVGTWMIYPAAALIVAGVGVIGITVEEAL